RRSELGRGYRSAPAGRDVRGNHMTFAAAEDVADAILYEGYLLYPYRAPAAKNQFRWQFGVVAPRAPRDDGEPSFAQTECLIEPVESSPRLSVRVRFLRPQRTGPTANGPSASWLEGIPHAIDALIARPLVTGTSECALPLTDAGVEAWLTIAAHLFDPVIHVTLP